MLNHVASESAVERTKKRYATVALSCKLETYERRGVADKEKHMAARTSLPGWIPLYLTKALQCLICTTQRRGFADKENLMAADDLTKQFRMFWKVFKLLNAAVETVLLTISNCKARC